MARNPEWYACEATSRERFLTFLTVLREDREAAEDAGRFAPPGGFDVPPNGWDNWTIAEFLSAVEAFAEQRPLPEHPSWEWVARLLVAGKDR